MRACYILLVVTATLLAGSKAATISDNTQASVTTPTQVIEPLSAAQTNDINQRFLRSSKTSNNYNEESEERVVTNGDITKLKDVLSVKSANTEFFNMKKDFFEKILRSPSFKNDILSNHVSGNEQLTFQTLLNAFRLRKSKKFDKDEIVNAIRSRSKTR
ncbi:Putative RxLR effector [Phytophthora palmivora]|uniref:RxLR effector protein n=1 Tax=Phytophthora palmivora TaxID=4796 RepID=A0A2P4WYN8_9STRA|nr:Putative RxLR effector [Phytophthora palmivora]